MLWAFESDSEGWGSKWKKENRKIERKKKKKYSRNAITILVTLSNDDEV